MECAAVSFCQTKRIIGAMCRAQLEKGFLGGRYLVGGSSVLELHEVTKEFLQCMLAGSTRDVEGSPYLLFKEEDITYIVCGTFLFDLVNNRRLDADSRIVYFLVHQQLNKANLECDIIGENFHCVPFPIMWTDVSESKKRRIEIFMKGIRLGCASEKDDLFFDIGSEEFYSLLKLDRVHLLEDYEIPMKCKHYVRRQLIELQNTSGGKFNEDSFIYDNQNKRAGPILIGGNCGIGKSEFLKSVAGEIGNDKRRTVLIISIGSLAKTLNRANIVEVICEQVYGQGYRSRLLAFYLSEIPNLEVMLDGVDDNFVSQMQIADLLDAFEYLKMQLPLSRLWVTFNNTTLLEYFSEKLGVSAYRLENFTYDQIVHFFVGMWSKMLLEDGVGLSRVQWKDILSIAEACSLKIICMTETLVDIPMICLLVGNYLKEEVKNKINKFELKKATFTIDQLYLGFLGKGYQARIGNTFHANGTNVKIPIVLDINRIAFITIFPEFSDACKSMDVKDSVVVFSHFGITNGTKNCEPPNFIHHSFAEFCASNRIFRFIERKVSSGGLKQLEKCIYDLIMVLGKYCSTSIVNEYQPAHLSVAKFLDLQLGRMEGWANNIDNSKILYPNLKRLVEMIQS